MSTRRMMMPPAARAWARALDAPMSARALSSTPKYSPNPDPNEPKSPMQRIKDFFTFIPDAPWFGNSATTFRSPAPGSDVPKEPGSDEPRTVKVPSVENTDALFNTQYYTRDTRRNKQPVVVFAKENQAMLPKMSDPELSSPGRFNANVMRYDPSGSRSAMTTNRKAVQAQLALHAPDHLPTPAWRRNSAVVQKMVEDAKRKGIPVPPGVAFKVREIPPAPIVLTRACELDQWTYSDRELDGKW